MTSIALPRARSLPACSVAKSLCVSISSAERCTRCTSASVTVRFWAHAAMAIKHRTKNLLRIPPVISHTHVHHEWHFEALHVLHLRFHDSAHGVHLVRWSFEHQFI